MSVEDLKSRISLLQDSITDAKADEAKREKDNLTEINKIMDDFKAQYDNGELDDEYVEPIEEIKE